MRSSISKRLIMTYSAVLGVFLIITALLLNITARKYMGNTIIKNLHTESAIIEELYLERMTESTGEENVKNINESRRLIKLWFTDINKLADIGFSSDIALILKTDDARFGIFTSGETKNEINFRSISADDLETKLKNQPHFFSITGGKTSFYAVSRPLSKSGNQSTAFKSWIISFTPIDELDRLVRDMNIKAGYAVGISLLVAALLSWYLSVNISKPVKTLKAYAEKIASRDFDARVHINTGDEIESLGQAMNKIAGDLKEHGVSQKRLLQNVSHELKTPVTSIIGYAEGIRDGVVEDEEKALNVIIEECERLQRLINQVLYLSKLETVEEFYSFEGEKINEIIVQIRDKMQNIMDTAGIELKLKLDNDCDVEMDRDKLTQALINLLSNAVRYARSVITIETFFMDKKIKLTVSDDGPGIEQNDLEQVFERFYKAKKGNTGLGLTITKAIVEKHNGTITAANLPEGGAVFEVILPVI